MQIPIWYKKWEYYCCGADIRIGDRVAWWVYLRGTEIPAPCDESLRITVVSETDVEAVWRWVSAGRNADDVAMVANWGALRAGICMPGDQGLNDHVVCTRGQFWYERHVAEPIVETVGTVQAICWHRQVFRRIAERHSVFERYDPGIAIASTEDTPNDSGDFRFMVELEVTP